MQVKDLVALLQQLPQEAHVLVCGANEDYHILQQAGIHVDLAYEMDAVVDDAIKVQVTLEVVKLR